MPTVQVGGVPPPLSDPHIVGQDLVGQATVGTITSEQFDLDRAINIYKIGGVPSRHQFGTVSPKRAVTMTVGSVTSRKAFGTVTTKPPITRTVNAVGSAQAFGSVSIVLAGKVS